MSFIGDQLLALTKQLYPTGRAFNIHNGSKIERLHKALILSEERAYNDFVSTLFSILPDNDNFTSDDATLWETRLGLITNESVPLEDRKAAIIRKMNHPGVVRARQNYLYIQEQLQLAGFNVFVYENPDLLSPADIIGSENTGIAEHSPNVEHMETGMEHGSTEFGSVFYNCIANSIYENEDAFFDVGENLRATFYIGGDPLGTFADVDEDRKLEFRQLILRLKPVQSIGFLFINYI